MARLIVVVVVDGDEVEDGVVDLDRGGEEVRVKDRIRDHLRRIRRKSKTKLVGRIIIGDSNGRRRLLEVVVCLVEDCRK